MEQLTGKQIIAALGSVLSPQQVKSDDDTLATYGKDWSPFVQPASSAIVFPTTCEEVQKLVVWANETGTALVPSGGRTGLSGGATATHGEVVVSFDHMNQIKSFDRFNQTVVCEAGVITANLQVFATEQGLHYPVNFASSGSSQIGGNIATNAGGIQVIRYGLTREWILGLKVVTGSGDILEFNQGLVKNATGYDLRHLFIGSEGTLGFVVEATIKLCPPPQAESVLVLALPDRSGILTLLEQLQTCCPLLAFEFFTHEALQHVLDKGILKRPFQEQADCYVLVSFENPNEQYTDTVLQVFEQGLEDGWIADGIISQSETQSHELWQLREQITESIAPKTPYKNDIAVVPSKVVDFMAAIDEVVHTAYPDFEIIWFGHIGDGNLHLNILKPDNLDKQTFFEQCHEVDHQVFEVVQSFRGSISAEHGVGTIKKDFLHYTRSRAEIAFMKEIKKLFDPNQIMNPGKIFD